MQRIQQLRSKLAHGQRSVSDTFDSVKAVFEKHNVVFTIGASLASAGAAWAGYTARQIHQKKVEDRLNSLEHVMATVHNLEEEQVKALTQNVGVSYKACAATAGTTLIIGYGLGFRGGRWFSLKRYQRQQQKLLQAAASPSRSVFKKPLDSAKQGASKSPDSKKTPSESKAISSESSKTPSDSSKTLLESSKTPSESSKPPSEPSKPPSESSKTPSESKKSPSGSSSPS